MKPNFLNQTFVLGTLLSGAFSAHANSITTYGSRGDLSRLVEVASVDQAEAQSKTNYFNEILSWYDAGTEVSFDDVKGGWSGRCFDKLTQTAPMNALLYSYKQNDAGPAFPSLQYLALVVYPNGPSDYFDNYDPVADEMGARKVVINAIEGKKMSPTSDTNGTLGWTLDFEPNGRIDLQFSVRKHGDFLIVRGENLIKGNVIYSEAARKSASNVSVGPWSACYFFKDLSLAQPRPTPAQPLPE